MGNFLEIEAAARRTSRAMSYRDRIVVDPAIRSGKPCVKGTRISVYDILEYLAGSSAV